MEYMPTKRWMTCQRIPQKAHRMYCLEEQSAIEQFGLFFDSREKPEYHAAFGIRISTIAAMRGLNSEWISGVAKIDKRSVERLIGGIFLADEKTYGFLERVASAVGTRLDKVTIGDWKSRLDDIRNARDKGSDPGYGILFGALRKYARTCPEKFKDSRIVGAGVRMVREGGRPIGRRELSVLSGVNEMYISILEHGYVPMSALDSRADRLALALGTRMDEIKKNGIRIIGEVTKGGISDHIGIMQEVKRECRGGFVHRH